MPKKIEKKNPCQGCSMCCEYITITIPPPKTPRDIDEIKWYLLHNVHVCVDSAGDWTVEVPMKCTALNNRGLCSIYSRRPILCREHTSDDCERHGEGEFDETRFTSIREFEKFLKKMPEKTRGKKINAPI